MGHLKPFKEGMKKILKKDLSELLNIGNAINVFPA